MPWTGRLLWPTPINTGSALRNFELNGYVGDPSSFPSWGMIQVTSVKQSIHM